MNVGTAQQYARWIGVLYIVTIVAGGWASTHANTLLIANDVAGTARRVAAWAGTFSGQLCRVPPRSCLRHYAQRPALRAAPTGEPQSGVAGDVFRAYGDVGLCCRRNALLCRRVTGCGCRCCAGHFAGGLGGAHLSLPHDLRVRQRDFRRILWHRGDGARVPHSTFRVLAPRTWRVILLGGAGFIAKNILVVAVPQYDVPYVLLPMFLAWCYWVLWLLIKGIDRAQWDAKQTAPATAER